MIASHTMENLSLLMEAAEPKKYGIYNACVLEYVWPFDEQNVLLNKIAERVRFLKLKNKL
jgi:hypothetical protein